MESYRVWRAFCTRFWCPCVSFVADEAKRGQSSPTKRRLEHSVGKIPQSIEEISSVPTPLTISEDSLTCLRPTYPLRSSATFDLSSLNLPHITSITAAEVWHMGWTALTFANIDLRLLFIIGCRLAFRQGIYIRGMDSLAKTVHRFYT